MGQFYTRAKLDLLLAIVGLVSVWLVIKTSSDSLAVWLRHTSVGPVFRPFQMGNQIVFSLAAAVLASLFTYYLLVRIPEHERNIRLRSSLLASYRQFKEAVVAIFIGAADGSYTHEKVEALCQQTTFRTYFKEPHCPGQNKWDAVANRMDDTMLRELVLECEILLREFQHVIDKVDIKDPELYSFMRRLSTALYCAKDWSSDYGGTERVLGFFWQILSGWSAVNGYSDREYVTDMIRRI